MRQIPSCGDYLLRWCGDVLTVTLQLASPRAGRAVLRSNLGAAAIRRQELIEANDRELTPLAKAWNDREMKQVSPTEWKIDIPLQEVGIFSGKCCFFASGSTVPEWPDGANFHVKVESATTRAGNAIYTVFPRQFGSFRAVTRRLDVIMGTMGFQIIQTLPVFPVPTTYAVMGEMGCPFAATDFFSVDPALAEFDRAATPLDQFRELINAVHARKGCLFVDLPANHTGWASTLQTHHPDWFHRTSKGQFISPGAWGVTWADLVELDYSHPELRTYMAEVFLFWVRQGVDGFRCDAGYMIPVETWAYIVARVREEYPDTVFMLEGLGGKLEVTDRLLCEADLDWAYSEIFQTYDRAAFEREMPSAIARARRCGTLVHFAETHDNDRLAKRGHVWAKMRVALAALLSHQGAWGIANGVEWFATEKIDVHAKNDLNWGDPENMVDWIAHLNRLLVQHPDFQGNEPIDLIEKGPGNFLAVRRGQTLILINLDPNQAVTAAWDEQAFPSSGEVLELMSNQCVTCVNPTPLAPGEVKVFTRCLTRVQPPAVQTLEPAGYRVAWTYPQDLARTVCVPSSAVLAVHAPTDFRVTLRQGARTVAVGTGSPSAPTILSLPPYQGNGTHAQPFTLAIQVFVNGETISREAPLLGLTPAEKACAQLSWSGHEIRAQRTLETVLANVRGASCRVKLAWGEIRSQYDSLLSANPNPAVPSDRLLLWTRCRCWLQHEGYSRELNADCIERVRVDPAGRFAEWIFHVPCGMGRAVRFSWTLSLASRANATRLTVKRLSSREATYEKPIRLVFRPDLEWRSFHTTTKAMGSVEQAFQAPGALTELPHQTGFIFSPYLPSEKMRFSVEGGVFHQDVAWTYCVPHPEEAARGQSDCGDLFSPGWISCDLVEEGMATLEAVYQKESDPEEVLFPRIPAHTPATLPLVQELRQALKLFVVQRDDVQTVIAGYPWFLDWGRDTFIFLQGAIPAGFKKEALQIVEAFARFEENGTLPNIIYGQTAGNRDTVDAQLWFIRTLAVLGASGEAFRPVARSIVSHYMIGTSNCIHMDPASALIWAPSHFTWMDTNYPACTPRVGYAVEIQALWIAALHYLNEPQWEELAARATASLIKYFSSPEHEGLADCLDAPNGESAAEAVPDWGVRPNQLFVVCLGVLNEAHRMLAQAIVQATAPLLVPGGIRTLDARDARYHGVYAGDEDSQRKPAYHNGTVWGWPFPMFAEALVSTGLASKEVALSLLSSLIENLNAGCVGHLSECADGDQPHAQKACSAQAWSASEALRVFLLLQGQS